MKSFLSIIFPARNEENRLPDTLENTIQFLDRQPFTSEILVVENASSDRTLAIAQDFAARYKRITVLQEPLPGKGRAVQRGMLAATGKYRFMADADLSMPIDELERFLPPHHKTCDLVIGSREAKGAVRFGEPEYRHIGGRAVNLMIRTLVLPGFHDTQCGFKLFTGKAAENLFKLQTLPGWSFDIEILFLARKFGYSICEIPIIWHYRAESKVRPVTDSMNMFLDILRIRWNASRRRYNFPAS